MKCPPQWFAASLLIATSSTAHASGHCLVSCNADFLVKQGTMLCLTYSGIDNQSYDMNEKQLKSLGCVKATSDLVVKPTPDDEIGSHEKVKIITPDRVFFFWVRTLDMSKAP